MKVLVHGLLKAQQNEVQKRYKRSVDLVFTDNQKTKINNLPDRDTRVIIVTKFSSHRHVDQLRSRFTHVTVLPPSAAVSSVMNAIDSLLKENT